MAGWDEVPTGPRTEPEFNELWPGAPGVTGDILPINRDPAGQLHLAVPGMVRGAVNSAYNALVGPGEILTGKTPTGASALGVSPESVASDITASGFGLGAPMTRIPGSLGVFGGVRAKTADMLALEHAKELWANDTPRGEIWNETNWFRDIDGQWKFEIPDTRAGWKPDAMRKMALAPENQGYRLGDLLDHPDLFSAYPGAENMRVGRIDPRLQALGEYDIGTNVLNLNPFKGSTVNLSTALHELQHSIQGYEGFAGGGAPSEFYSKDFESKYKEVKREADALNSEIEISGAIPQHVRKGLQNELEGKPLTTDQRSELGMLANRPEFLADVRDNVKRTIPLINEYTSAFNKYHALSGEVEARNVQARKEAGDYAGAPWMTEGYPRESQIIRFDPVTDHLTVGKEEPEKLRNSAAAFHFDPVEHNPFQYQLEAVEHDPFASAGKP